MISFYSIDELLEKQRKKRLRENERKYANSISSKKSKRHNKKDGDQVIEVMPALPTLPKINNVDLYAGEKKNSPWLYQQQEQQNSFYYDSQPMTPLESSYSLQRNPTNKYDPYNEAPRIQYQNSVHQPAQAYTQPDNTTSNYYYSQQPQYSNDSTAYNTPSTAPSYNYFPSHDTSAATINKPHVHDDYSSVAGHSQRSNVRDTHTTNGGYSQTSNDNYNIHAAKSPSHQYQQNALQHQQNASHYQQSYEDLSATTQPIQASSSYDDYYQNAAPQATNAKHPAYTNYI